MAEHLGELVDGFGGGGVAPRRIGVYLSELESAWSRLRDMRPRDQPCLLEQLQVRGDRGLCEFKALDELGDRCRPSSEALDLRAGSDRSRPSASWLAALRTIYEQNYGRLDDVLEKLMTQEERPT